MVRARLDPSGAEFTVEAGERVLDAIDAGARFGLPTACRAGNCGMCLVHVRSGEALIREPDAGESRLLSTLNAPAGRRLGCQLSLRLELDGRAGPLILFVERGAGPPTPRLS